MKHALGASVLLIDGLANFFCKGLDSTYFRLCGTIFFAATQLSPGSMKAFIDDLQKNEHACVSVKLIY